MHESSNFQTLIFKLLKAFIYAVDKSLEFKNHTYRLYSDEIYACISKTEIFVNEIDNPLNKTKDQKIVLTDEDSVLVVFNHRYGRVCVLNFASYKYAGGDFLSGGKDQKEFLYHESFLYNVSKEENSKLLTDRIRFILNIASN